MTTVLNKLASRAGLNQVARRAVLWSNKSLAQKTLHNNPYPPFKLYCLKHASTVPITLWNIQISSTGVVLHKTAGKYCWGRGHHFYHHDLQHQHHHQVTPSPSHSKVVIGVGSSIGGGAGGEGCSNRSPPYPQLPAPLLPTPRPRRPYGDVKERKRGVVTQICG